MPGPSPVSPGMPEPSSIATPRPARPSSPTSPGSSNPTLSSPFQRSAMPWTISTISFFASRSVTRQI
eukprot:7138342-Pyramimonas_sp.AAC.1